LVVYGQAGSNKYCAPGGAVDEPILAIVALRRIKLK
jgi:hypothetical protein